jgi:hypothetical protein
MVGQFKIHDVSRYSITFKASSDVPGRIIGKVKTQCHAIDLIDAWEASHGNPFEPLNQDPSPRFGGNQVVVTAP